MWVLTEWNQVTSSCRKETPTLVYDWQSRVQFILLRTVASQIMLYVRRATLKRDICTRGICRIQKWQFSLINHDHFDNYIYNYDCDCDQLIPLKILILDAEFRRAAVIRISQRSKNKTNNWTNESQKILNMINTYFLGLLEIRTHQRSINWSGYCFEMLISSRIRD